MAASATFALKAGVWFRRGRLLMVSPDSRGTACPPSGRNSTYRPVQISGTGSKPRVLKNNATCVAAAASKPCAPASVTQGLSDLRVNFFRTNRETYLLLGKSLCLAREIQGVYLLQRELAAACKAKNLTFNPTSRVLNRVLCYVTDDHGNANSYAATLRNVPDTCVTPEQIADFISKARGVQKLRLSTGKSSRSAGQARADE